MKHKLHFSVIPHESPTHLHMRNRQYSTFHADGRPIGSRILSSQSMDATSSAHAAVTGKSLHPVSLQNALLSICPVCFQSHATAAGRCPLCMTETAVTAPTKDAYPWPKRPQALFSCSKSPFAVDTIEGCEMLHFSKKKFVLYTCTKQRGSNCAFFLLVCNFFGKKRKSFVKPVLISRNLCYNRSMYFYGLRDSVPKARSEGLSPAARDNKKFFQAKDVLHEQI